MINVNNYTIEEIKNKFEEFNELNDVRGAYEYFRGLDDFVKGSNIGKSNIKSYKEYSNFLIKFKLLSLEFFDNWKEVEELLKHYFNLIYDIPYYNLWDKIKLKLLAIPDLKQRDGIKDSLKKVLMDSDSQIISRNKYKEIENFPITVEEWIKDFIVNLGVGKIENLKKVQYLTNSKYIKKLDKDDKDKIESLFNLYQELKILSSSKEGFEGDVPVIINNENYIFSKGKAEKISSSVKDLIRSVKFESESKADGSADNLNKLREMAEQYPSGSLEYKVIKEEIEKLSNVE